MVTVAVIAAGYMSTTFALPTAHGKVKGLAGIIVVAGFTEEHGCNVGTMEQAVKVGV